MVTPGQFTRHGLLAGPDLGDPLAPDGSCGGLTSCAHLGVVGSLVWTSVNATSVGS